jgi:hypothetical protein
MKVEKASAHFLGPLPDLRFGWFGQCILSYRFKHDSDQLKEGVTGAVRATLSGKNHAARGVNSPICSEFLQRGAVASGPVQRTFHRETLPILGGFSES